VKCAGKGTKKDGMETPQKSIIQFTPGMLVAIFFVLTACSLLLGSFISFSIVGAVMHVGFSEMGAFLLKPENAPVAQFANALASIISFGMPAFFIAKIQGHNAAQYLGLQQPWQYKQLFIVVLLGITGLFLSGAFGDLSEKIPMSASMKSWADGLENQYKEAIQAMTKMNGWIDLMYALLAIALIPAIVEELFFRSGLQTLLSKWLQSPWMGIIITSIIFSAFHFSFYGFLSRVSLGIILGAVYYFTGSIWLSICMHFINNAIGVITLYVVRNDVQKADEIINGHLHFKWLILSGFVCIYLLFQLKKITSHERLGKSI
jgi:membrane protease YdiL (CAAX protease family)